MIGLLLAFGAFAGCSLIGLALLALFRADTTDLRMVLSAPAVGSAVAVLALFLLSAAGAGLEPAAIPLIGALLAASVVVLVVRRPHIARAVLAVGAICIANLLLLGWPMFSYGTNWIANANDDMANYILAATNLLHHGVFAHFDVGSLSRERDYASALQIFQVAGVRPGGNILLAGFAAFTGRPPYEVAMALTLALNLCTVCGVGALAAQASRRVGAALVAAAILAVSPLAAFGVVQQLLPQVWGLALAVVLLALVMRPELHHDPGPTLKDVALIGIVAAALVLVYVEVASTLALVYALYVALLAARRRLSIRSVLRLWGPVVVIVCLVLNVYLVREVQFLRVQASYGVRPTGDVPLFGYVLTPIALPVVAGLETLSEATGASSVEIAVAAAVLLAAGIGAVALAVRGVAAAIALVAYTALGLVLAAKSSDFGLFKLFMYVQPFLAATVAVAVFAFARRRLLLLVLPLAFLAVAQVRVAWDYVDASRDPIDLRRASSTRLLPAFQRTLDASDGPVVAVTENPVLAKLEAARAGRRPLHLMSRDFFTDLLRGYLRSAPPWARQDADRIRRTDAWQARTFGLRTPQAKTDAFRENTAAAAALARPGCRIVFPSGAQQPFNRRSFREESDVLLVSKPCRTVRNVLVFIVSRLGESYYIFRSRENVSFYQLEADYFTPGRTFAAFGRYALFRVVRPSRSFRLALTLTSTLRHDGRNRLPAASVVGAQRRSLPLVGRGSARVYSAPLEPQMIDGRPYVLLDMGDQGLLPPVPRSGLRNLFGRSIPLDTRYVTAYVRDVSLLDNSQYRQLQAPAAVRRFPQDLTKSNVEYSGIYEDGWVGEKSYLLLAGGAPASLVLRAEIPAMQRQGLRVSVDGRTVFAKRVSPGSLRLRVPLRAAAGRRRIELDWSYVRGLPAPDLRPVAARLTFVGLTGRSSS
jgi:hypothetical protein